MSKIKRIFNIAFLAIFCFSQSASMVQARPKIIVPHQTFLEIANASNMQEVATTITLPASSICGSPTLANLSVTSGHNQVTLTPLGTSGLQGWFNLKRGNPVIVQSTSGFCLGGVNVAFIAPPQCPCSTTCQSFTAFVPLPPPGLPNGVNQAEVTLNVPSGSQEAVEITCNTGANSTITITSTGGPQWETNNGAVTTNSLHITNSSVDIATQTDNNCSINGVLGWQLSTCTAGPASCVPSPGTFPAAFCNPAPANPTCIFQRSQVNGAFGGTVRVSFLGPLSP